MQSSGKLLKVRSIHPLEYDRWNNVTLTRTKLLISMELNKNPVIEVNPEQGTLCQCI